MSRSALPSKVCSLTRQPSISSSPIARCGKQPHPAYSHLFVCPGSRSHRIDPQNNMEVVTHHGIGIQADGKNLGQFEQTLFNPRPPMFIRFSVIRIDPAQPRSPHAAGDAVVETGRVRIDKEAACSRHADSVTSYQRAVCRKLSTRDVRDHPNYGCPGYACRICCRDVLMCRFSPVEVSVPAGRFQCPLANPAPWPRLSRSGPGRSRSLASSGFRFQAFADAIGARSGRACARQAALPNRRDRACRRA